MPGSGLRKAAVFCVQWTAGTYQITAEFKMSTKAASMGCLFVYPCPLMSFSVGPNWFVSTSIHTMSQQYWQRKASTVSGFCLDLLSLFKLSMLHQTLNGLTGWMSKNKEIKIQVSLLKCIMVFSEWLLLCFSRVKMNIGY